jgi:putative nucleotidyltransferase with HDIG domain
VLKKISIDELEEGMFVDSIAEQQGSMKIKSRGRVSSVGIINKLKSQGIIALNIDLSKQLPTAASNEPSAPESSDVIEEAEPEISFEEEIGKAKKLHQKGKGIQKRMLDSVGKGLPIDIAIPKEFTDGIVSSIDRNPNALLCMTKIREKDSYLLEHSLNVAILLATFATHVGLSEEEAQELSLSGFLHDIGKINIPDSILHKPGRLTDQEMVVMQDHVYYGIRTLEEMEIPERIIRTIGEHHERLDGYGYPEGKRGDEISVFGRMIAIVDTYDAITADRCYKDGMPSKKALQILLQDSPEKYDQGLVQKFIKCIGIYPVGSLVKLSSEKIAMVVKQHETHPIKPIVKVFYSVRSNHYLPPVELDLSQSDTQIHITKAVTAKEFKLDFNKYFSESIAV